MEQLLSTLAPQERAVVVLKYIDDLTVAQIGAALKLAAWDRQAVPVQRGDQAARVHHRRCGRGCRHRGAGNRNGRKVRMNEFGDQLGELARNVGKEYELTSADDSAALVRRAKRGRVLWTGAVGTATLASAAVIAIGGNAAAQQPVRRRDCARRPLAVCDRQRHRRLRHARRERRQRHRRHRHA